MDKQYDRQARKQAARQARREPSINRFRKVDWHK